MRKNKNKIPINTIGDMLNLGIFIDRNSLKKSYFATVQQAEDAAQAHRDEGYTFHILEKGKVVIEIDFKTYNVSAPIIPSRQSSYQCFKQFVFKFYLIISNIFEVEIGIIAWST